MQVQVLKPIQQFGQTIAVGTIVDLPPTRVAALGDCVKPVAVAAAPVTAPAATPTLEKVEAEVAQLQAAQTKKSQK